MWPATEVQCWLISSYLLFIAVCFLIYRVLPKILFYIRGQCHFSLLQELFRLVSDVAMSHGQGHKTPNVSVQLSSRVWAHCITIPLVGTDTKRQRSQCKMASLEHIYNGLTRIWLPFPGPVLNAIQCSRIWEANNIETTLMHCFNSRYTCICKSVLQGPRNTFWTWSANAADW